MANHGDMTDDRNTTNPVDPIDRGDRADHRDTTDGGDTADHRDRTDGGGAGDDRDTTDRGRPVGHRDTGDRNPVDDRNTLDAWTDTVCQELRITGPIDRTALLDLTKDVARGVARPAAPLTAYLVGLAVGAGGDPADLVGRVGRLASSWPDSRTAPER
jgi:hypothetical protein